MKEAPLWLSRPLINWIDVYRWGAEAGIKKMMPPDQLHLTLATVRAPVSWDGVELIENEIIIPAGHKSVQIFAWTIKALTFGHPEIKARHESLVARYPQMDHPLLRPHVSLYKGGRMPQNGYEGELVFGPERLEVFDAENYQGIKHVKLADYL